MVFVFGKFKDIETRILEVDPQPLFSNIHIKENGVCVPSVPLTKKWSEFLFDLWNWCTHELFEENYVTQMDVNHCGRGKLYAACLFEENYVTQMDVNHCGRGKLYAAWPKLTNHTTNTCSMTVPVFLCTERVSTFQNKFDNVAHCYDALGTHKHMQL